MSASPRMLGIPFIGALVPKVMRDEKWVTRRLLGRFDADPDRARLLSWDPVTGLATFGDSIPDDPCPITVRSKYRKGDRLYVQETIRRAGTGIIYAADGSAAEGSWQWRPNALGGRYMRRALARTWLDVLDVRPERLQEISEEDARAEGIEPAPTGRRLYPGTGAAMETSYRAGFIATWDRLHGPESWKASVWVWRILFRRVAQEARAA